LLALLRGSFSRQLGLALVLGISIVSGSYFIFDYRSASSLFTDTLADETEKTASLIALGLVDGFAAHDTSAVSHQVVRMRQEFELHAEGHRKMAISVYDMAGRQVGYAGNWQDSLIQLPWGEGDTAVIPSDDARFFFARHRMAADDGTPLATIYLVVETDVYELWKRTRLKNAALAFVASLLFAFLFALLFGRWFGRPIEALVRQSAHLGSGKLSFPPLCARVEEVRELAEVLGRADRHIAVQSGQMRAAKEHLQAIHNASPDMFLLLDRAGNIVEANDNALAGFSLSRAQLLSRTLDELMAEMGAESMPTALARAFAGTAVDLEGAGRRGELVFPVEVRLRRLPELPGESSLVLAILTDITERRRAERESRRLAQVVQQASESIAITDAEGRLVYVNPAWEKLSGYTAAEALGHTPRVLKSGEHPESYYATMWRQISAGKVWSGSFVNRAKDGRRYEVEQNITPIFDARGAIVGYATVQRDVTQQKEMQARMQHTQRLESLGVLAGGIAHDFNNLLTVINGNAAIALDMLEQGSSLREFLRNIEDGVDRAAELCRQMLAYAGKGRFVIRQIDMTQMVEEMGSLLKVSIGKNVQLHYELSRTLPPVEVDVAQLQQVVMNLVINASEAIGEEKQGLITLRTGVLQVDAATIADCYHDDTMQPGDYVICEVSDNGSGMSEETLAKIFDPFFTTKVTGRGLGMSAVLGIVRGHRGGISLKSTLGEGTRFRVLLPVAIGAVIPPTVHPASPAEPEHGSGTVLVVDDEESIRIMASRMLDRLDYQVLTAENGKVALDLYTTERDRIALVLLDVTMPVMDGEECFRRLREIDPGVRVLLSSGFSEQEATSRFVGLGLAGFLQKPYRLQDLAAKLHEVMGRQEAAREKNK